MRPPELLGGLARPMHQPIRLPGILGHRRSAYLRPSALSVSGAPGIGESAGIRIVHVPYVVEQDEDGVWCANAQLRPGSGR